MNWDRIEYDWDGETRYCWKMATPIGELCIDFGDWLDAAKPWGLYWYPADRSDGELCGRADTDAACKLLAVDWIKELIAGLSNVLAAGEQRGYMDDGN